MSQSTTHPLAQALAALREALAAGSCSPEVVQAERLVRQAMSGGARPPEPQGSQRLIIADDEALMRQAMVRALSRSYEVEVYEDGESVWQAIVANPPAAVLLDVNMPGLTGLDVVQRMRETPALADTPVVLVTARSSERNVAKGIGVGADDYLIKPFRPKELRARLSRLLNKSAEKSALVQEQQSLRQRAEVTAELLHDMGNVLSSVGVTAATLAGEKGTAHAHGIDKASELLDRALTGERAIESGAERLPLYLRTLASAMTLEQQRQHEAAAALQQRVQALDRLLQRARTHTDGRVQTVPIRAAVDEALLICSGVLEDAAVEVSTTSSDLFATVDPDALQQVLVNLVQNAVDAMRTTSTRSIHIAIAEADRHVRLSVQDTGVGMSSETRRKLFERGFSTKGDSRGLGLSSCRRIVEDMDGTLTAHSDGIGHGSCFELVLPRA